MDDKLTEPVAEMVESTAPVYSDLEPEMGLYTRLQAALSSDLPKLMSPVTEADVSTSSQQTAPPTESTTTTTTTTTTSTTTEGTLDTRLESVPDAAPVESYLTSSLSANLIAPTISSKSIKQRKDPLAGSRQKLLEEKFRTLKIRPPKLRKLNESIAADGSRTFGGRGWKPRIGYSSVAKPRSINYTQHGGPPEEPRKRIQSIKVSLEHQFAHKLDYFLDNQITIC